MAEGGRLKFDVALGADLVQSEPNRTHLLEIIDIDLFQIYDTDLVPLLISTVQDLFSNYGVGQFIIAATLRNEDTFRTFLDACEENTFTVEVVPFGSTPAEEQSGFFHSTSIPIRTYRISRG